MRLFAVLFAALCAVAIVAVTPSPAWQRGPRVDSSASMSLTVGLRQQNLAALEKRVALVSDPQSKLWGDYWTIDQIAEMIAPDAQTTKQVIAFFKSHSAKVHLTKGRDFLEVLMTAKQLETMLDIQLFEFKHRISQRIVFRTTDNYKFPSAIAPFIDVVTGVHEFFDFSHERKPLPATPSDATVTSNAPEVMQVFGGANDLAAVFKLFCYDGSAASPTDFCSGAIESVTVTATPSRPGACDGEEAVCGQVEHVFTTEKLDCELVLGGSCRSGPLAVLESSRYTVHVTTNYAGSKTSNLGVFGFPAIAFQPAPYILPSTIYERYNVPSGLRATNAKNSQAVPEFERQYVSLDDLADFFENMGLPYQAPIMRGVDNPAAPGGEATLDLQYIMGVGRGVNTTFWSVSGPGPTHGNMAYVLEWALQMSDSVDAPLVNSISYGDTEQGFLAKFGNYDYIHRMNAELAKLATRGITVIAGSGDAGASNVGEAGNDISNIDPTCSPFRPFFPSNSPYVTSLSASFLTTNAEPICRKALDKNGIQPVVCNEYGEVAVSISDGIFWTTGGGFSGVHPRPSWQDAAVSAYMSTYEDLLPPSNLYNQSGRAYPDLSALGHNLLVTWNGVITPIGGTSAAGPVMAGIFSLINDAALNAGHPSIGLANPFLYQAKQSRPAAFNDITVGSNADGDVQPAGSKYPQECSAGFSAAPGWDPVTGLGSVDFPELLKAFFEAHELHRN